jgi:hypothetical protein
MQFTAKLLLFLALAASLAAPQPLRACLHGGTEFGTCCYAANQAAKQSCCLQPADDTCDAPTSAPCACCAPSDPRNLPTDRTTVDPAPLVGTLALSSFAPVPLAANASATLPSADPGGQAAIPHRILHCSWLI